MKRRKLSYCNSAFPAAAAVDADSVVVVAAAAAVVDADSVVVDVAAAADVAAVVDVEADASVPFAGAVVAEPS